MREVASFLGNLSAVIEAVPYGRLIDMDKSKVLKSS